MTMAAIYGQQYEDVLNDVSSLMASSRLSQRLSRDSGTFSSIHSTRSSRIEKPRSTNNSPRAIDKRKTVSTMRSYPGHARHSTMATTYDNAQSYGNYVEAAAPTPRPMSWHPSSAQFHGTFLQNPSSAGFENQYYSQISPPTMNGHSTSMHAGPYSYDMEIPSSAYPVPLDSSTYQMTPNDSPFYDGGFQSFSNAEPIYTPTYDTSPSNTSWYMPEWPASAQTLPQTQYPIYRTQQDFLPIQHPPELEEDDVPKTPPSAELEHSNSKILVGMGLYDPPATPPHPFMSALSQGKGLKLEEAWVPPAESDDDDDAEDDGEEEEQSNSQPASVANNLPTASQNVARQIQSQTQWPVAMQPQITPDVHHIQSNLQGQTFFFEEGEDVGGEWWYQQLKNPRAVTQSQGIGYGWLGA